MKAYRRNNRKGFTLVEILIVVIILGILAAIVIPQFTNASTDARNSSLASQLQTLRSQIELYKLQHGDTLPVLAGGATTDTPATATNWNALTVAAAYQGTTYGPYMQAVPTNPLNTFTNVIDATGAAATSSQCGFVYDYTGGTGKIFGTLADGKTISTY